jgi:NADPH-dependent 2,4-dienoyl-CoA reductase/sulfur reductase-like enzyme
MLHTIDIVLPLEVSEDLEARRGAVARILGVSPDRVRGLRLRKHSIDARQRQVKVQLRLEVAVDEELPEEAAPVWSAPALANDAKRVLIVGAGPAGLFAALRCLELGAKPIILERDRKSVV